MKLKLAISLILISFCLNLKAQDYQSDFIKFFDKGDTLAQKELLEKWERAEPNNAELYTSYFNYYFSLSRKEAVSIDLEPKGEESLEVTDSTNQQKYYINGSSIYLAKPMQKGINYIDKGIKKFPNRLDMRFGKIYAIGQQEDWETFTADIVKTIDYSNENKNKWTWTNNEPVENPEGFFLSSLQDYILQLYNTEEDSLLLNMRRISAEVLKFYSNNVENLSNISLTYILLNEYDKGIEYLLKAEKLNPEDYIVLGNIAYCYKMKEDKENSIKYYEKVIKYGDEQSVFLAKKQIEEFKK